MTKSQSIGEKIASELKVPHSSLQRIVKRDMDLFSFTKRKVHYISKEMKEKRLKRSKGLIDRFAIQGLDHALFSDEILFIVEEAYNQQNDRILSFTASAIPEEYRYVKEYKNHVMLWFGLEYPHLAGLR
ncbi:CRE-PTR-16 protein [Oopsacas minuta]|uniref:CRE-PTR-16 protein n=1 Tax=Oopsacas minuta TaxID=111878 RepID=A0AAV7JIS8_9METZ|nr:CRE-PTR-16 protein [Oopsacas minuta]